MVPVTLYDLSCNYHADPIGIDDLSPKFGWKLPPRCKNQKAFEISISRFDLPNNDHWKSGKIISSESNNVSCVDLKLDDFTRYRWTLVVWDELEKQYSATATFVTGAISEHAFRAEWIAMQNPTSYVSTFDPFVEKNHVEYHACYVRKEFESELPVHHAYVYVSAAGIYELRINGVPVGDRRLDPAPTDFAIERLYSCYDVTDLMQENNCAAAVVGNGRYLELYGYDKPEFFFELHVDHDNGQRQIVSSDSTWHAAHGPIRENGLFYGEHRDGRLENDEWWKYAGNVGETQQTIEIQRPKPVWQQCDPIRSTKDLEAKKMTRPSPGVYVFDFGQNISGVVSLRVQGSEGTRVTIRHAELLAEDGTLNTSTNRFAEATDIYTLSGQGAEFFEPHFTYHGFRYADVRGFPGAPALDTVQAHFLHTDVRQTGTFSCSNGLINQIHQNILWGQRSNLMGIPTDCPQRAERHGWIGDAHLTSEEALYNFSMPRFYKKYLHDIKVSQREDGALSCVIPKYWDITPADPVWGTAYITLAWNAYWHFGDRSFIEEHYDGIKQYVDYLHSVAIDGIIGDFTRLLFGDWCPPGSILPKRTPMALTNSWFYYHDTKKFAEIAYVLGQLDDSEQYRLRAETIQRQFNEKFLTERGYAVIRMGPRDPYPGQTSNLLPLYLDMVPDDRRQEIVECLLKSVQEQSDYHVDTGIAGTRYLFDVLTDLGETETAYHVATQGSYPGWGYMIEQGATTLWERWERLEGGGMNSQNHIMFGSIDAWFYKTLAGIKADEPGWKTVCISPTPVGDLTFAQASVDTVRGPARVSWEQSPDSFTCAVTIPQGATGKIQLPIESKTPIIKEGSSTLYDSALNQKSSAVDNDNRITSIKCENEKIHMTVESGDYNFSVIRTKE